MSDAMEQVKQPERILNEQKLIISYFLACGKLEAAKHAAEMTEPELELKDCPVLRSFIGPERRAEQALPKELLLELVNCLPMELVQWFGTKPISAALNAYLGETLERVASEKRAIKRVIAEISNNFDFASLGSLINKLQCRNCAALVDGGMCDDCRADHIAAYEDMYDDFEHSANYKKAWNSADWAALKQLNEKKD